MKTMGQFIQAKRKSIKMTQRHLAKCVGWKTAQFVSNIERDVATLPPEKFAKMARVLGMDAKVLIKYHVADYERQLTEMVYTR